MGNLARDPEIRYSQGEKQTAVVNFSIAVSRRFSKQGEDNVDFFNCVAFGKTGEFVNKYFAKGSKMLLCGNLQNNNYTNKNGEKVYAIKVIVEEVEFAQKKSEASENTNATGQGDFMNIPDGVEEGLAFN